MCNSCIVRQNITILLFITFLLSCTQTPHQTNFPIVAWHGPDYRYANDKTFQDLRRCGFSINFSVTREKEFNIRALELALKNNLQLLISDSRIDLSKLKQDSTALAGLDSVVIDYIAHPALLGYFIDDEPSAKDFKLLAKIVNQLREKDPYHPAYINLFPIYATPAQLGVQNYKQYLENFLEIVHPPLLSFDHYPIMDTGLRDDYFENLEIILATSLKYNVPFWGFALSVSHEPYPKPHQGHLRFQLYCNLAYGAKGLQYFSYATPKSSRWNFREALLDTSGNKTTIYRDAFIINNEIHKLAPILLNSKSIGIYHTPPLPIGCQALASGIPIQFVEDGELVMGFFQDDKNHIYVMLVNRDYMSGSKPRIYFAKYVKGITEVSKNSLKPLKVKFKDSEGDRSVTLIFKAGEGSLFRLYM